MEKRKRKAKLENRKLYHLIRQYPQILPILDRYGISFCAGCYLTLTKTPKEAAAFHAAPDAEKFLRDLSRVILKKGLKTY
jgi:iron-sulfur cluster repair protein YtfE (RIC family)